MTKTGSRLAWLACCASALALAACGGGGGGGGGPSPSTQSTTPAAAAPPPVVAAVSAFAQTNLVSDQAGVAATTDPNLVDAWGIAFAPGDYVWIANNGTNTSTIYDGAGVLQQPVVAIPPGAAAGNTGGSFNPTGIVSNGGTGFTVSSGGQTGVSVFIFDGEQGVISGWAPNVNLTQSINVVDNSAAGAVYKGLAIYTSGSTNLLFASNFHTGNVDVFDSNFHPTTVAGGFKDPNLPSGYAPFGIQVIGSTVYVTYAKQDAQGFNEVDGAGLGYVDSFDTTGTLIQRLVSAGPLNAPWGIAVAPANWGTFSNDLLIGNFGDGKINIFNPATGAQVGVVNNASDAPIVIPGLWGIAFGNGAHSQSSTSIYFTSGPSNETHGLYGRLDLNGTYTPTSSSGSGY